MNQCNYVRKVEGGFEYGQMLITASGEKKEKREYIPKGTRPTMDAALSANSMAAKGVSKIGYRVTGG